MITDERTYAQQLDLCRHQVRELTDARLHPDEDVALDLEYRRASNASRLLELCQSALGALSESDDAATDRLATVGRSLQELVRLDPGAEEFTGLHAQAGDLLRELQHALATYGDRAEVDPTRLAEVTQRLDLVQSLKRKYGPTLVDVAGFLTTARATLAKLEGREAEAARLQTALVAVERELNQAALALSKSRQQLGPRLAKAVQRELLALGFRQAEFQAPVTFDPKAVTATGGDTLEFGFAPNPGEAARPLRAIASSGELARVMLALKTVLAAEDEVPVLVFDEVDANIGGETAQAVGVKLRQLARAHQVLCITHLAPVAAQGHAHYVVSKEVTGGRTESTVVRLPAAGRTEELARMLGCGPAARRHAAEMLKQA